ncbi:phosphomevalonate kinase [Microvirga lupini]|uniref:Phosphomevalonate kinase n=1 Tax=Microvirga lupini TaxID=420324 RepID=A0A7W4YY21_9HYPH|nr:hypothetical protein [Microvirga lupini]MBB3020661.1 phosphomevalonate kinase [Microvirga lupini]
MTTFKIKSFADLEACFDEITEERLQDTARLLSSKGATDEEIRAEIAIQRQQFDRVKAEATGTARRGGESLQ